MINWNGIEGFSKGEFAPPEDIGIDWDMHQKLINKLVELRETSLPKYDGKFRVLVHENGGFAVDGHSEKSLHYGDPAAPEGAIKIGRAVDFHMEHYSIKHNCWALVPWLEQAMLLYPLLDEDCWGVGLYPNWNQQGFHLDYRLGVRDAAVWWTKPVGGYKGYAFDCFSEALMDVLKNKFMVEEGQRERE